MKIQKQNQNQKSKKQKLTGAQAFESYYSQLFADRWETLKQALLQDNNPVRLQIADDRQPYFMDIASILAAATLPTDKAESILDMCAAPGGKTLVVSGLMNGDCRLLANDRSADRVSRLKKVVSDCLPDDISDRITVICKDAGSLCKVNLECFDAILLDAPCSSERHVMMSPAHLELWSPSRVKTLAVTQWALLSSAFRMLRPGGYLLYVTCALSSSENDDVVAKLVKKFDNAVIIDNPDYNHGILEYIAETDFPTPEKTLYGSHILPDRCHGAGPLYYCLITKK